MTAPVSRPWILRQPKPASSTATRWPAPIPPTGFTALSPRSPNLPVPWWLGSPDWQQFGAGDVSGLCAEGWPGSWLTIGHALRSGLNARALVVHRRGKSAGEQHGVLPELPHSVAFPRRDLLRRNIDPLRPAPLAPAHTHAPVRHHRSLIACF